MTLRALFLAASAATWVAGCSDVGAIAGLPGGLTGGGPPIRGTVKDMSGPEVRVGVIGSPRAGGKQREIVSTTASAGTFSLSLPASPPVDMMEQPDETRSVVFTLRAYADANRNQRYDDGETLCECSEGQFRFFASDGAPGSYKAGWNVFANGKYTQSFTTAFNL